MPSCASLSSVSLSRASRPTGHSGPYSTVTNPITATNVSTTLLLRSIPAKAIVSSPELSFHLPPKYHTFIKKKTSRICGRGRLVAVELGEIPAVGFVVAGQTFGDTVDVRFVEFFATGDFTQHVDVVVALRVRERIDFAHEERGEREWHEQVVDIIRTQPHVDTGVCQISHPGHRASRRPNYVAGVGHRCRCVWSAYHTNIVLLKTPNVPFAARLVVA